MANSQKMDSDNRKLIRSFSEKNILNFEMAPVLAAYFMRKTLLFHALEIIRKAK